MNRPHQNRRDVLIVGAGPVGLDLASRLLLAGYSVRVLEQRTEPTRHSRSIGIHPPGLEALAETGVADRLIDAGQPVREGVAMTAAGTLGNLSFARCPGPYPFVLAVPQWRTEEILESRLMELDSSVLERGRTVAVVDSGRDGVSVRTTDGAIYDAGWLVGCDGKDSVVRNRIGIGFPGRAYRDRYVMGDFRDETGFGPKAVVFLCREGLVESFPLPDGIRRWVVRTEVPVARATPSLITGLIADRTGAIVDPATAEMTSSFGVQRCLATTMATGRVLLAGDAAHLVSPIGGQGMNLGWLDSRDAAVALTQAMQNPKDAAGVIYSYSRDRRRAASRAASRSEFNMAFGRPSPFHGLKIAAARVILTRPLVDVFARRFTMRGL